MACARCGSNNTASFRSPSTGQAAADATAAATGVSYEVLDSNGRATGRTFSSLIAASGYARRLGGSTRPA